MAWIKTVDRIRRMDEIMDERIRVAVLAERERCWKAVLTLSSKELREYESATASVDEYVRHLNRHDAFTAAIAAIREDPKD